MSGENVSNGIFISGSFVPELGHVIPMANEGDSIYSYFTYLSPQDSGGFYFLNDTVSGAKEIVPDSCAMWQGLYRKYIIPEHDINFEYSWSSCKAIIYPEPYTVQATFKVDMRGQDISNGVYITGHLTGDPWQIVPMSNESGTIYSYSMEMMPGDSGAYYYLTTSSWDNFEDYREKVPAACALWWGSDRGYKIANKDTIFAYKWESCDSIGSVITIVKRIRMSDSFSLYPNPGGGIIKINTGDLAVSKIKLLDLTGRVVLKRDVPPNESHLIELNVANIKNGSYILSIYANEGLLSKKLVIE